jgi:excisionase family DNA binding protein
MEQFLTVAQAAERLQVHPETVRRMIRRGDLPFVKVGTRYRIDPADLATQRNEKIVRAKPETPLSRFATPEWRNAGRSDDAPHGRRSR